MPEPEFHSRLESARREIARRDLAALVIYGDNYDFGDLCYLTNYFPKVRGGIAVVPREGPVSLLLNIGSRDVPFAKTLTWVDDVRASNQLGRDGAALLKEKALASESVGLVDSGKGFPLPQLEDMKSAVPEVQWQDCDLIFAQTRLHKGLRELAAMREAGRMLSEICRETEGLITAGRKEHEIVAAIDRLARNKGVEDIRVLAGARRLQPPSLKNTTEVANHWAVYFAIQHERYWAEAGRTYLLTDDAKVQKAYDTVREIVAGMAAQLKPPNALESINEFARQRLGEFYDRASVYGMGNGIGLSPWERPFLSEAEARAMGSSFDPSMKLAEGMTLALRAVFETGGRLIAFGNTFQVTADGPLAFVDH